FTQLFRAVKDVVPVLSGEMIVPGKWIPIAIVVPTWVHMIDRLMVTVQIRILVQFRIPDDEPSDLGIIVPSAHLHQPRIPFRPVACGGPIHVGTRAAARGG